MKDKKTILILETQENKIIPSHMELINFATLLTVDELNSTGIIIIGEDIKEQAKELSAKTGIDIVGIEGACFKHFNYEIIHSALLKFFENQNPKYICFMQSVHTSQLAPILANDKNFQCITSIEEITIKNNEQLFTRSLFGGKIKMQIKPSKENCILTILPGAFAKINKNFIKGKNSSIKIERVDIKEKKFYIKNIIESESGLNPITEADVVIAAGKGIKKEENLEIIRETASIFKNSAVGASRTVCDNGWLPSANQVGITGKTVTPKLYMACGISGSHQHIVGMKDSQLIVSINSDPNAAIFSVSDYIIIEDLSLFLPVFIERHKNKL